MRNVTLNLICDTCFGGCLEYVRILVVLEFVIANLERTFGKITVISQRTISQRQQTSQNIVKIIQSIAIVV